MVTKQQAICLQCGGDGGEYIQFYDEPMSWHTCYHCYESGRCDCDFCSDGSNLIAAVWEAETKAHNEEIAHRAKALEPVPMWPGDFPYWMRPCTCKVCTPDELPW